MRLECVREGRGRDDLTDEITEKKKKGSEGGRPPTRDNVPQRQRHPGAVGRPSAREVSRETFNILYFLPCLVSCSLLALCCSLDGFTEGGFPPPDQRIE